MGLVEEAFGWELEVAVNIPAQTSRKSSRHRQPLSIMRVSKGCFVLSPASFRFRCVDPIIGSLGWLMQNALAQRADCKWCAKVHTQQIYELRLDLGALAMGALAPLL